MTYQTAMEYMNQIGKKGSILGLANVKELLRRLGNPQDQLTVIHVAGTNGKGSICTFLDCMYQAEGKRVGRYISPTLFTYLERFQVNGKTMKEVEFADIFTQIYTVLQDMQRDGKEIPTAFEVETAVAFCYFVKEAVDIVILETGMGGREDATNVVAAPYCTVFASIGMDHMQFLGDTVEKIAYQKAGIIKRGCPVVSYPNTDKVCEVLRKEWRECNEDVELPVFQIADRSQVTILEESLDGSRFCYKGEEYEISLAGDYQVYNAVTAIETKLLLDGSLVKDSLKKAKWSARFEKLSDRPLLIRDGAHNMDGVQALKISLEKHFTNTHIIFIIGILKDKEYEKMIAALCPMATRVYTITPPVERGLSGERLREDILPYCKDAIYCESVAKACHCAGEVWEEYDRQGQSAVIVAWGSLSYMGLLGRN